MKAWVTVIGILMTVLGVVLLARGVGELASVADVCSADGDCGILDMTLSFGGGIVLLTIGMLIWSAGANALRSAGSSSPLTWLGYFGIFGAGFAATGAAMLYTSLQPGEDNPGGVLTILGVVFGLVGIGVFLVEVFSQVADRNLAQLRVTGLHGRGIVTGISDTGVTINMNPLVAFHLRVEVPGVQPHETTVRHQVNRLQVGALRPGLVVPVLADPLHPSRITVDWDSPMDATPMGPTSTGAGLTDSSAGAATSGGPSIPGLALGLPIGAAAVLSASSPSAGVSAGPGATDPGAGSSVQGDRTDPASSDAITPAEAQTARVQIESLQDMGVDLPGGRLYTFDLTVSIAGRAATRTRFASPVAPNLVPRLVKGASFPATVDPAGSGQLVGVAWDR